VVRVCDGTACHVKNSEKIYDAVARKLKLREGGATTADGLFTLETVACLGACGIDLTPEN
jgi:NADH-quinone oxidoreductase subunit E